MGHGACQVAETCRVSVILKMKYIYIYIWASAHRKENIRTRTRGIAAGVIYNFPQFVSSEQVLFLQVCACCIECTKQLPEVWCDFYLLFGQCGSHQSQCILRECCRGTSQVYVVTLPLWSPILHLLWTVSFLSFKISISFVYEFVPISAEKMSKSLLTSRNNWAN